MSISVSPPTRTVVEQFNALANEWKAATTFLSSTTTMTTHPAYLAIIALGPAVVPLLLADLKENHVHWFEALRAITGDNPVPRENWGNIPAMTTAWLAWGTSHGLA
jgi:hypothetical protein